MKLEPKVVWQVNQSVRIVQIGESFFVEISMQDAMGEQYWGSPDGPLSPTSPFWLDVLVRDYVATKQKSVPSDTEMLDWPNIRWATFADEGNGIVLVMHSRKSKRQVTFEFVLNKPSINIIQIDEQMRRSECMCHMDNTLIENAIAWLDQEDDDSSSQGVTHNLSGGQIDMAEKIFNCEDYGIPKDKFDYIRRMVEENDVKLMVEMSHTNPNLNIADCQQHEQLTVDKHGLSIAPRQLLPDMFIHKTLVLTSKYNTHRIYESLPKEIYDNNGNLVINPRIAIENDIPEDIFPLYRLVEWFGYLRTFWKYFVADDIYNWAESNDCSNLLINDDSYLYNSFEWYKKILKSLISIFGYDVIENAMDDLSVCKHCGEPYVKE